MRWIIVLFFLQIFVLTLKSQIKAVTEKGDEVILYDNGKWSYIDQNVNLNNEIVFNPIKYEKSKNQTFLVKSNKFNIGIWLNPKEWSFSKGKDTDEFEFQFENKGAEIYGMFLSEKLQIPIENLKSIAYENAKSAAPDLRIIKEDYRLVNGIKVFMMQMTGTINGISFTYFGYYYSNENGTIQLLTYTSGNQFNENYKIMEDFLNGFVEY